MPCSVKANTCPASMVCRRPARLVNSTLCCCTEARLPPSSLRTINCVPSARTVPSPESTINGREASLATSTCTAPWCSSTRRCSPSNRMSTTVRASRLRRLPSARVSVRRSPVAVRWSASNPPSGVMRWVTPAVTKPSSSASPPPTARRREGEGSERRLSLATFIWPGLRRSASCNADSGVLNSVLTRCQAWACSGSAFSQCSKACCPALPACADSRRSSQSTAARLASSA